MSDDEFVNMVYRQVTSKRAVSGNNFPQGVIDYDFSIGGSTAWVPSRSYLRVGLTVSDGAGNQPNYNKQIAIADGVCGNLFNNVYMRAGGQDISSLVNYVPQGSAIKNRTMKSGAWLKSLGASAFGLQPDFNTRVKQVSTGTPTTVDGELQTFKLGTLANKDSYQVTISILGAVASANADFSGLTIGDSIMIDGIMYPLTAVNVVAGTATTSNVPVVAISSGATGTALGVKNENTGSGRNVVYVMYQPPIGIFDHDKPMGSGDYRLQLNPNAYYKTSCVESVLDLVAGSDFNITVDSMELYIATCNIAIPPTGVETLFLNELNIQSKTLSGTGDQNFDFTIPSSTKAISVFVQSGNSGNTVLLPPSMFKTKDKSDTNIRSLQLTYANQTKPSTRWQSEYASNTNRLQQRYLDTQIESGLVFSDGGSETFADFIKRGLYYHYGWIRDSSDRSTQLQLNIDYSAIEADAKIFVVSHFTRTIEISVSNGFVSDVKSLTV